MHELGWTWADLQATPPLIVNLWTQLLMARRAHEAAEIRKAQKSDSAATAADRVEADRAIAEAEAALADDPEVQAWLAQHGGGGRG